MATTNPKSTKYCGLCISWKGDAEMKTVSPGSGLINFNDYASGVCKRTGFDKKAGHNCPNYQISPEASGYAR